MIAIIAAMEETSRIIGIDGKIPWNIKGEMKQFKELTTNNVVIMGRKTFESMGSKPLPNRINIVITSKPLKIVCEDNNSFITSTSSLIAALDLCDRLCKSKDIFIIGGARLYEEGKIYANTIYLTEVKKEFTNIDKLLPEAKEITMFPEIYSEEFVKDPYFEIKQSEYTRYIYHKINNSHPVQ